MEARVLVVGAGPTGLMLAGWLARLGVPALVVDKKDGPSRETRALGVQARTMETYDMLGLGAEALAGGVPARGFNMWVHHRHVGRLQFADMAADVSPHPYMFIFGQDKNEAMLLAHLRAHGGDVQWRTELVGLTQDDQGVAVTLKGPDGVLRVENVAWVCGCDGASSGVRHAVGVGFPGGTYEHRFFVADVGASGGLKPHEVNLCLDEARFGAFFPMPGEGRWRVVGMLEQHLLDRQDLTFEDVRGDVEAHFPAKVTEVTWFSTYNVHHRVAEHFRVGRVFLLGDAGHIHSPAGGQGMNTGLMDATNLGWKLAMVCHGTTDDRLVWSYAPEREPFARQLVETTDRAFSLVTSDNGLARFVRTGLAPGLFPILTAIPAVRAEIFGVISQTRVNYRRGPISKGALEGVQPGDRLPWVRFTDDYTNYDGLKDLAPRVHVYGELPAGLEDWVLGHPGLAIQKHPFTPEAARKGLRLNAVYLVRPDGYVGYAALRFSASELDAYLRDAWGYKL
ncbi:MAG: hypothetical protein JWM80_5012 [Cyanobacteria bacterium RYN_339]|nr:hypothetical protein [Cyanobacteria bacterium RYN_339]